MKPVTGEVSSACKKSVPPLEKDCGPGGSCVQVYQHLGEPRIRASCSIDCLQAVMEASIACV